MRKTKQQEIDRLNEQIRVLLLQHESQKKTIQQLSKALKRAKESIKRLLLLIDCQRKNIQDLRDALEKAVKKAKKSIKS